MIVTESVRRSIPADARVQQWAADDGWALRRFDWFQSDRTPRGSILFQGGRGDIFEKYLESFDHWHARGWNITSFDWRGQGGSGRLTSNPHCGHVGDFAQYVGDLRGFHAEWRGEMPGPHVVMGHSMGGHLVLRGMIEGALAPDAAVLVAPMLGIKGPVSPGFAERLARILGGLGNRARPAWKGNEKPHTTETRQELLTRDLARYEDELFWQQTRPELLLGPPSWHWVIQAFASTREMRTGAAVETMAVPLLMLVADADQLVDPKAALAIAARLPDARVVRFGKEAAHELLREGDAVRNRALGEIDLFLDARAPQR